ncbi:hypothetical protein E5676_scaffold388G00910 [Cucumis melo var. makuwa]|uniref:Uncharacterized protein n=1 Tax=Cucumis melo var. makuwa TaxID=1194695 RepID=A0A5D3BVS2_CUCMM|nr:hypothetical protein E5676_scaffold388G00910 [Cucumis melo var. makuwa]
MVSLHKEGFGDKLYLDEITSIICLPKGEQVQVSKCGVEGTKSERLEQRFIVVNDRNAESHAPNDLGSSRENNVDRMIVVINGVESQFPKDKLGELLNIIFGEASKEREGREKKEKLRKEEKEKEEKKKLKKKEEEEKKKKEREEKKQKEEARRGEEKARDESEKGKEASSSIVETEFKRMAKKAQ